MSFFNQVYWVLLIDLTDQQVPLSDQWVLKGRKHFTDK